MRRLVVGVGFVALFASNLQAAASGTEVVLYQDDKVTVVEDGDWIEWRFAEALFQSAQHIYRGNREAGGTCSFSMATTVNPAPSGWYNAEREIASNQTDCLMVTETGLATAADSEFDGIATQEAIPTLGKEGGGGGSEPVSITATKTVWYLVVLNDAANLSLVDDKAEVTFNYNGSCVTNSWDHFATWHWKWWWQESSKGATAARYCSYAETDTYSHFFNDSVCPGPRTWSHMYEVKVRGQENGSQTNYKNIWKTGGCSDALHWDFASS